MKSPVLQPLQKSWSEIVAEKTAQGFVEQEMQQNMEGESTATVEDTTKVEADDPYAGVDMDLLDSTTKAAIEKSRITIANLRSQANQASTFQSEKDRLAAEVTRLQGEVEARQPKKETPTEKTFEQELIDGWVEDGVDPKVAASMAKIQARAFDKFAKRTQTFVDSRVQPIQGSVAMQQATNVFEALSSESAVAEALGDPEFAQEVWGKIEKYVQSTGEADPEVIENLAIIAAYKRGTKATDPQQTPQRLTTRQPVPVPAKVPTVGRFTFPGAGHKAAAPNVTRGTATITDPETAAAVAATVAGMKNYGRTDQPQALPKITRGGR